MTPEERSEYYRQWRQTHKEQRKEYNRKHRENHREQYKEYAREYYENHREEKKGYHRQWYQNHKEQVKARHRKYYENHREEKKISDRKYREQLAGKKENSKQYCLSWKLYFPDSFQKLLVIQEGRCAVCNISLEYHQIHVDHDHETGLVRGLLCWKCNRYRVSQNRADNIKQVYEYLLNPPAIQLK